MSPASSGSTVTSANANASAAQCFHCQLPLYRADSQAFSAKIDGVERPMCCPGCAMAAQLIANNGFGGFYQYRTSSALSPDNMADAGSDTFVEFDNDDIQNEFVVEADGIKTASLAISGMSCAACGWLLEHYLKSMPGITRVVVNVAEQRMSVSWRSAGSGNSEPVKLSDIMQAISQLGYLPRPYLPAVEYLAIKAENRQFLQRLGVAGLLMMQTGMFAIAMYSGAWQGMQPEYQSFLRWASLLLALPLVTFCAWPFFRGAWRGLVARHPGMDLSVSVAIGAAFVASVVATFSGRGEVYFDSIAMFTFFLLMGRYLERRVRQSTGLASLNMSGLVPSVANRIVAATKDAGRATVMVPVSRLQAGDQVLVKANERIPCDAVVLEGCSSVNEASFTGESMPRSVQQGDEVSSGTLNVEQPLTLSVQATGMRSRFCQLLSLVDTAVGEKSPVESLADTVAAWFVVAVISLALLVGVFWYLHEPARMMEIVIAVLIVSCPCALSLATPLAMTAAGHKLKESGFILARPHALDGLARADTLVFDKTGTLTTGDISITQTQVFAGQDQASVLQLASALEGLSSHPIATAFRHAASSVEIPGLQASDFKNHPGLGVEAVIDGERYGLGSKQFVGQYLRGGIENRVLDEPGKAVFLFNEQQLLARFDLADEPRADARQTLAELRDMGVRLEILSGDTEAETRRIANVLGVSDYHSQQTPADKLARIRQMQSQGKRVAVVGDGMNDVPVLAAASVSIAVANATDLAKAKADCFLLNPGIAVIARALRFSRRGRRVIAQNLTWAVLYNAMAVPLAAMGWVPPWAAAIGMSASSLLVALNALRLRRDNELTTGQASLSAKHMAPGSAGLLSGRQKLANSGVVQ